MENEKQTGGIHPALLREHRNDLGESQAKFWQRFGITQSRGSRFEQGATIPQPVAILLWLYFAGKVSGSDLELVGGAINE